MHLSYTPHLNNVKNIQSSYIKVRVNFGSETVQKVNKKYFLDFASICKQRLKQTLQNYRSHSQKLETVFFHLTYFKKHCWKYIDAVSQCLIITVFILCNMKMNQISAIQQKIGECLLKTKKQGESNISNANSQLSSLKRLCNIFQAITLFRKGQFKKAKDSFSNIISFSTVLAGKKVAIKALFQQTEKIIQLQLILSSFYMSKIYQATKNSDLHSYMLKKCIDFIHQYIHEEQSKVQLIQKIVPKDTKQVLMRVKLTRVQSKIQKMKLIKKEQQQIIAKKLAEVILDQNIIKRSKTVHTSGQKQVANRQIIPKADQMLIDATTFMGSQVHNSKKNLKLRKPNPFNFALQQKQKQNMKDIITQHEVSNQLLNIFIIKDKKKNYFRLKEQTLKYISKESRKFDTKINTKKSQINQIKQNKHAIQNTYNINSVNQKINIYSQKEKQLMAQIQQKKWKNINQLPPVKKLSIYLKGYIQQREFQHSKNVYKFVYGEIVNHTQMKIISHIKRKANTKNKEIIKKVNYNKIQHQIQFIRQKTNEQQKLIMNIYQYQKGELGINLQQQITMGEYQVLKSTQFYYLYYLHKGRLLPFSDQIFNMSFKGRYLVHKFIKKVHKFNKGAIQTSYKVQTLDFNYNQPSNLLGFVINCRILIRITETVCQKKSVNQSIQQHDIQLQRIDRNKYHNQNYNISIKEKFFIKGDKIQKIQINKLLTQKLNAVWRGKLKQINKIQEIMKRKLAINMLKELKTKNYVFIHKIQSYLYTLRTSSDKKIFYIQNLKTKEIFIQKNVHFTSLEFIQKIDKKLSNCKNLEEQYKILEKYLKIKHFANRIFHKSKNLRFFTDFQTQFRKRLCFAKVFKQFLFRGKMRQQKIMFMLTVKQFSKFPRPYSFRIFTLDSNAMISVDVEIVVFNKQKIFFESKLNNLNQVIEVLSKKKMQILDRIQAPVCKKVSSRVSIMSNYSFQSGSADSGKQDNEDGNSSPFRRISKNSMFMKFRHKALIRNQDIQILQKIMAQNKYQQNQSSQQSQSVASAIHEKSQKQV